MALQGSPDGERTIPRTPGHPDDTLALAETPVGDSTGLSSVERHVLSNGQTRYATETILGLAKSSHHTSLDLTPPRFGIHQTRQTQERDIYNAVRRQLDVVEERLSGQISMFRQMSERQRDTALTRMESKVSNIELLQPKVDRRLAELNGNVKALSEESQTQVRRMDQMDSRLWEWRHKMDEDIRLKFATIEQTNQELASSVRVQKAGIDDVLKKYHQRLLRLEQLVDEKSAQHEDFASSLLTMHTRLLDIEHDSSNTALVAVGGGDRSLSINANIHGDMNGGGASHSAEMTSISSSITVVNAQLAEMAQKIQQLQEENYDIRAKMESQEEHHKVLRSQFDAKDELVRSLDDRINRENWDHRMKEFSRNLEELHQSSHGHSELSQILQRKLDSHEETQAELTGHIRRLQERHNAVLGLDNQVVVMPRQGAISIDGSETPLPGGSSHHQRITTSFQVQSNFQASAQDRIALLEEKVKRVEGKMDNMADDLQVAPRVAALIETLKDLGPKVIGQEEAIKEINAKVEAVETELRDVHEKHSNRLKPLEVDVQNSVTCQTDIRNLALDLATRVETLEGECAEHKTLVGRMGALEEEIPNVQGRHSGDVTARVTRLEDEMKHLGGGGAEATAALAKTTTDLSVRVNRLEEEVRHHTTTQAKSHDDHSTRLGRLEKEVTAHATGQADLRDHAQGLVSRMLRLEADVHGDPFAAGDSSLEAVGLPLAQ